MPDRPSTNVQIHFGTVLCDPEEFNSCVFFTNCPETTDPLPAEYPVKKYKKKTFLNSKLRLEFRRSDRKLN